MSELCLLMRMALAAFRSESGRHLVRGRQSSCAMPRSGTELRDQIRWILLCLYSENKITRLRLAPNRELS